MRVLYYWPDCRLRTDMVPFGRNEVARDVFWVRMSMSEADLLGLTYDALRVEEAGAYFFMPVKGSHDGPRDPVVQMGSAFPTNGIFRGSWLPLGPQSNWFSDPEGIEVSDVVALKELAIRIRERAYLVLPEVA